MEEFFIIIGDIFNFFCNLFDGNKNRSKDEIKEPTQRVVCSACYNSNTKPCKHIKNI